MINRLFGILTTDVEITADLPGYRYSDARATDKQKKALRSLMPSNSGEALLFADYLLKLLSCSPYWPEIIRKFDPENSYDIPVVQHTPNNPLTLSFSPIQRLINWAKTVPASPSYPTSDREATIDFSICKLLGVLTDV